MDEIKTFDDYYKLMVEEDKKQFEKDSPIWENVKKLISKKALEFLEEYFEETGGNNFNFEIVDEPSGNKQEEWDGFFVWVDQWRDGGYSGDDFAGHCYFKLKNNKYFKWEYSC